MRSSVSLVSAGLVCAAVVLAAQMRPQNPPQFRGGVDVVELDVSVYDKDHHPIKGLKASDFTLLEDKLPRPLVGFSEVDIPEPPPPPATWMRDAAQDVATNEIKDHRLFLLVVDDASFEAPNPRMGPSSLMFQKNRDDLTRAASAVINRLGPTDLAAVVFTGDNRRSQEFTSDHRRLVTAIQHATGPTMDPSLSHVYAVETIRRAVDALIGAPGKRKALVDLTYFDVDMGACFERAIIKLPLCIAGHDYLIGQTKRIFESAQRAGVTVSMMRMDGSLLLSDGTITSSVDAVSPEGQWSLRVPSETGGETFLGVRDPAVADAAAQRIFEANSSYYMLGYTSADLDKFHFIKVLVDRPDAVVKTREKYYGRVHEKEPEGPPPPVTVAAMSGLLPKDDIPLQVTVAPFAAVNSATPGAVVAVVLKVRQIRGEGHAGPIAESLDLRAATFTAEGDPRGVETRTVPLRLPAGDGDIEYEILHRADIAKPGLYELRLSVHSAARNAEGSIYVTVDMPDFAKEPISLSGVVLSTDNGLAIDGAERLKTLLPVTPTTARAFDRGEPATAFLRAYEGGGGAIRPVAVHTRIVNDHDQVLMDRTETFGSERFDRTRSAGIFVRLPTGDLAPGPYLLSLEATLGKAASRRELRFVIK
jgi:VWFA-related protein